MPDDAERIRAVFPSEMLECRQWIPYSATWSENLGKFDKIPLNPNTGYNAKSNDPKTWGTFDLAVKRALNRKMAGVGFVFSKDDPFVGIDLDKCLNGNGKPEPWASEIIQQLDSYTESSPSGKGYHIIGRGRLPPGGRRTGRVEMYDSGRFFTVTGVVAGPGTLRDIQEDLDALHARLFKKAETPRGNRASPGGDRLPPNLTDAQIIERATKAANGAKFDALWRGDWQSLNYPSQSEADQALCDILGWWVNYDTARLDGLFRQSELFRPEKWDTPHFSGGQTYGGATVEKAVSGHSADEGYKPAESTRKRRAPFSPGERLTIVVNRQLAEVLDDVWELVHAANRRQCGPSLFQRSGQLVQIRESDDMSPYVSAMSKEAMTTVLFKRAAWVVRTKEMEKPSKPHPDVVAAMLCYPDANLPYLSLIAQAPFFNQGGQLITTDGYHKETRAWLRLSPDLKGVSIPDKPTEKDIRCAVTLLMDDLLADFPFADQSDRAHALAALLLPFVRTMIHGSTPLHLIEAPTPGSGKTLLANLIGIIATGEDLPAQTLPHEEEEVRKRLTTILRRAPALVLLDNVTQKAQVDSSALCSILTTTDWTDRLLGVNEDIHSKNQAVWLMTANNPRMSMEIASRTIRIRLDPRVEEPWEREGFRHEDIRAWTRENRRLLVVALLTIVAGWIAAGRPFNGKRLGRFEQWTTVIGGILQNASIDGFLTNRKELYQQVDDESSAWREFFEQWWEKYQDNPLTVKDLLDFCSERDLMTHLRTDNSDRSQQIRLGRALKLTRDRVISNYRLRSAYAKNASGNRVAGYQLLDAIQPQVSQLFNEDENAIIDLAAPF